MAPIPNNSRGNRTRFVHWVRSFGFSRLARELGVSRNTVHYWVAHKSGRLVAPSSALMTSIIALSEFEPHAYGPLTYDDMLAGTTGLRGLAGSGYAAIKPLVNPDRYPRPC